MLKFGDFIFDSQGAFKIGEGHSFMAGKGDLGEVIAAGRLHIKNGYVTGINNHTGHFQVPGPFARQNYRNLFNEAGINTSKVKKIDAVNY